MCKPSKTYTAQECIPFVGSNTTFTLHSKHDKFLSMKGIFTSYDNYGIFMVIQGNTYNFTTAPGSEYYFTLDGPALPKNYKGESYGLHFKASS